MARLAHLPDVCSLYSLGGSTMRRVFLAVAIGLALVACTPSGAPTPDTQIQSPAATDASPSASPLDSPPAVEVSPSPS